MQGSKVCMKALLILILPSFITHTKISWGRLEEDIINAVCQLHVVRRRYDYCVPYRPGPYEEVRGSGFLISPDGEILTNSHVVMDAVLVWITLPGCGKLKIPVRTIGQCPDRDIALLKVTDEGYQMICQKLGVEQMAYLSLGDSDNVHRWDKVYAVGYPLGQKGLKGTKGVISGPEYSSRIRVPYLQMDAAINPGSSGGPLLSRQGEVVGITTSGVLFAQNVGYIVPINYVKNILDDLHQKPIVFRPYLGIYCNKSTEEHAQYLCNPLPAGLYIYYVQPNSIADNAGIREGDMLYKLNGYDIDEYGDTRVAWSAERVPLNEIIARFDIGQSITFQIYRNGKCLNLSTECTEPVSYRNSFQYGPVDFEIVGGMTVMQLCENHFELLPMSPYLLEYARPDKQTEEVLVVTNLTPGTEIERVRQLMPGTLIAEVNEQPVHNLTEFRQALTISLQTGWLVIKTHGEATFVFSFPRVMQDQQNLIKERVCPATQTFVNLWSEVSSQIP